MKFYEQVMTPTYWLISEHATSHVTPVLKGELVLVQEPFPACICCEVHATTD